jgi:hypothetical protein
VLVVKVRVAIHPVTDEANSRRIAIYRRTDGGYTYAQEERMQFTENAESVWSSQYDHDTRSGVYDSVETALEEAQRDVPWLSEMIAETQSCDTTDNE